MVLFVMPKSKKRGGSTSSNGSETGGPSCGTTTTRRRAGAGERADTANPIPVYPWGTSGFSDTGAANGSGGGRI